MRTFSWILVLFLSSTVHAEPNTEADRQSRFRPVNLSPATKYPAYENSTNLPLTQRPLQTLGLGSTFQIPRNANGLGSIQGVYDEKGPQLRAIENSPHCYIRPEFDSESINLKAANRDSCTLVSIEGDDWLESGKETSQYWTRLELMCRETNLIKISCYQPSNGKGREMTLGVFETIMAKKFNFGSLVLESPLNATFNGILDLDPVPVTPSRILSGRLKFSFSELGDLSPEEDEFSDETTQTYGLYLSNGETSKKNPVGAGVSFHARIPIPKAQPVMWLPTVNDFRGLEISRVSIGYDKKLFGRSTGDSEYRYAHLMVTGKKKINGVESELTVFWSDPEGSHITYDSMAQIPGRETIKNWYDLGVAEK